MSRVALRTYIGQTGLVVSLAASVVLAAEPPNVIFVLTDDQAPWAFTGAGNPQAHTPNMDRLARQGATFANFFVTTPVCSPSRAGLVASRYGTELGITDWLCPRQTPHVRDESELGLDPSIVTWPAVLSARGYATALIGKWHLGIKDRYHPTKFGYGRFAGFRRGGNKPKDPILEIDGREAKCEGLLTDILTDHAITFLRENAKKRFLLSLHYRAPHTPWLPVADEDWAPFEDLDARIPNPNFPDLDIPRLKKMMRQYLASTAGVDRNLGRLMSVLDELNLTNSTVLIYTSDHGYNMGHNGIWHKGNGHRILKALRGIPGWDARVARPNMYDNSIRVPTLVRWPGVVRPGTTIAETISNLDWYPTLAAIAGAEVPKGQVVRGRSFLPLIRGESVKWDNDLYGEYSQHHYTEAHLRMYRTPEWKLIRDFKNAGKDELYHLAKDPAENHNLINDQAHEQTRKALESKLLAKMKEAGDELATANKPK